MAISPNLWLGLWFGVSWCGVVVHSQTSTTTMTTTTVGVDLGGGIVTRTDVRGYANLSLDLRDIRASKSAQDALLIYHEGKNAMLDTGYHNSFLKLHQELTTSDIKTPDYVFHQYGLAERSTDPKDFKKDADKDLIEKLIKEEQAYDVACEAIVALTLWQYSMHLLYAGVQKCRARTEADKPDMIVLGGGGMDEFIALWIGLGQTPADTDGYSLYSWAQNIAGQFGHAIPEALVNTNIKQLYQEGAVDLSLRAACSKENGKTAAQLWNVAVQISNQMMIPLYQSLIYSVVSLNGPTTQLYATALIPLLSQCRASQYTHLKELLLDSSNLQKADEIILALQETYSCFGLTCEDIGMMQDHANTACKGIDDSTPVLAGYTSSSDVRAISRLDLDIYQIEILATLGSWDFAKLIYLYGRNAPKFRDSESDPFQLISLHDLANSADRKKMDYYAKFIAYYENSSISWGDKAVLDALAGNGKWAKLSEQQRIKLITLTCAYQIVFLEIIGLLRTAFEECEKADSNTGFSSPENPLDQSAALMIGSMEGSEDKGSQVDGEFLYGLANERALEFDTVNRENYAIVNSEIEDLLYAAKGQLDALDCVKVARTTLQVEKIIFIPLLQGIIHAAIASEDLPTTSTHVSLVEGEVYTTTVLPFVNHNLPQAANKLSMNMIVTGTNTVPDGAVVVGDTVGEFVAKGLSMNCNYLGHTDKVKPCRNFSAAPAGYRYPWLVVAMTTAMTSLVLWI